MTCFGSLFSMGRETVIGQISKSDPPRIFPNRPKTERKFYRDSVRDTVPERKSQLKKGHPTTIQLSRRKEVR